MILFTVCVSNLFCFDFFKLVQSCYFCSLFQNDSKFTVVLVSIGSLSSIADSFVDFVVQKLWDLPSELARTKSFLWVWLYLVTEKVSKNHLKVPLLLTQLDQHCLLFFRYLIVAVLLILFRWTSYNPEKGASIKLLLFVKDLRHFASTQIYEPLYFDWIVW